MRISVSLPLDDLPASVTVPKVGEKVTPEQALQIATAFALRGVGKVQPNPPVGAVLVDRDSRFLAAAGHYQYGGAHAEINVIREALHGSMDESISGGSLYCTLEPCAHEGKTASCARAIVGLPNRPSRVIYAVRDPNPLVCGKGHQILEAAGIQVVHAAHFAHQILPLLVPFAHEIQSGAPIIAAKIATSLNGIVGEANKMLPITPIRAQRYGHWLRLLYDGILIGSQTLRIDNPRLTVRHYNGRTPTRIVLDPRATAFQSTADCQRYELLKEEPEKTFIVLNTACTSPSVLRALESTGATVVPVTGDRVDLRKLAQQMRDLAGCHSLLLEGGPTLWRSALDDSAIDYLYLFSSHTLLAENPCSLRWSNGSSPLNLEKPCLTLLENSFLLEGQIARMD
jgi:diaminohydroxyphosphoribosylaminopyrimidine deaminase/5-amino-6-(5-phosphoribosylamino)uracil reductase